MARHSRRFGSLTSILLVVGAILAMTAGPAIAATTGWDPRDQPQRGPFDLRWAGAYRQDADTIRVGISLWDPVRRWDFDGEHLLGVDMNPRVCSCDSEGSIQPLEAGGWVARFTDEGSPQFTARVRHPNPTLFQILIPAEWAAGEPINVLALYYGEYEAEDRIALVAP
jgi:hypothetical protein